MERALTRLRDQENKKAPSIVKDFKVRIRKHQTIMAPFSVHVRHPFLLNNTCSNTSSLELAVICPCKTIRMFIDSRFHFPCAVVCESNANYGPYIHSLPVFSTSSFQTSFSGPFNVLHFLTVKVADSCRRRV